MGSVNDNIRDVKRAYRKKSFQTGYALAGDSVEATPVPQHTYSTPTHQPTSVVRPGIDARTYLRGDGHDGPQAVYSAGTDKVLDLARYPWSLIPKGDSSNVIQRQLIQFAAADSTTTVLLSDNEFVDALVINVTETNLAGTQFWTILVQILLSLQVNLSLILPLHSSLLLSQTLYLQELRHQVKILDSQLAQD